MQVNLIPNKCLHIIPHHPSLHNNIIDENYGKKLTFDKELLDLNEVLNYIIVGISRSFVRSVT